MKKLLKPARIAFYFLMLIAFFILGLVFAGLINAGKNQGLAGGAIVLGYGVLFGGIAFIASFFIAHKTTHKFIIRANWVLFVIVLISYGIIHYKYQNRQKTKEIEKTNSIKRPTTSAVKVEATAMLVIPFRSSLSISEENKLLALHQETETPLGLGFFKPNFFYNPTLYFYGGINPEKGLTEHSPFDSIVTTRDQYGDFTSTYAPPWLWPEYMKLEYGIMYFKVITLGRDFIKVVGNSKNGKEIYLNKNAGKFLFWPEMILSSNIIEFIASKEQIPKIKPLDYAEDLKIDFTFMRLLLIKEEWLFVALQNNDYKNVEKGWIRWKKDNELLIIYSFYD